MRTGPRGQNLTLQKPIESEYWRRSSASTSDLHSIASLTNTINTFTSRNDRSEGVCNTRYNPPHSPPRS